MTQVFHWNGQAIPFLDGETVASALARVGIFDLGPTATGGRAGIFCGIGQCQGCLVEFEGRMTEACLLAARSGMAFRDGVEGGHDRA